MGVGDVGGVGEVEEVVVVADLEVGPLVAVDLDHVLDGHAVAFAKDGGGPDGAGEELIGRLTVGFEDEFFGFGLERGRC
jgi:hypothetical protein